MSNIGSEMAFPLISPDGMAVNQGLTKREHFAAMAMQGYCGGEFTGQSGMSQESIAKWCVDMADALINALNPTTSEQ